MKSSQIVQVLLVLTAACCAAWIARASDTAIDADTAPPSGSAPSYESEGASPSSCRQKSAESDGNASGTVTVELRADESGKLAEILVDGKVHPDFSAVRKTLEKRQDTPVVVRLVADYALQYENIVKAISVLGKSSDEHHKKSSLLRDVKFEVRGESSEPEYPAGEIADVIEAFARHRAAAMKSNAILFLSVKGKNPSAKYMKRFAGSQPRIRPGSLFAVGTGMHVEVQDWKFLSPTEVELKSKFYLGNVGAGSEQYKLTREKGKWLVKSRTVLWLS